MHPPTFYFCFNGLIACRSGSQKIHNHTNMNSNNTSRKMNLAYVLAGLFPALTHAAILPKIAPVPMTWTNIAESGNPAPDRYMMTSTLGLFTDFEPPVIAQYGTPMCAFKGYLNTPPSRNEGVWSNGAFMTSSGFINYTPTNVVIEGNPIPGSGNLFGSTSLPVRNLQITGNGTCVLQTTTNLAGQVAIYDNNTCLQSLGETPAINSLRPPVIDLNGNNYSMWKQLGAVTTRGVEHGTMPGGFFPPCAPPLLNWFSGVSAVPADPGNQVPRVGSPSISQSGWTALYARDFFTPAAQRNHIRVVSPTALSTVVVRENQATGVFCPPISPTAAAKFGVIHTQLLANTNSLNTGGVIDTDLVAWQMQNMRTSAGVLIPLKSLWCKQAGNFLCLGYESQPAPEFPALTRTIKSFYALHAAGIPGMPFDSWVVWGVQLDSLKYAVYCSRVTSGVVVSTDLLATDDTTTPTRTPVDPLAGPLNVDITTLDRFFSVSANGDIVFKATCAGSPAGKRRMIVTARPPFHERCVRAQSGVTPMNTTPVYTSNFQLAQPEQGTFSRGQAINALGAVAAKVRFGGKVGIFVGQ
jgi:hypothetical protein